MLEHAKRVADKTPDQLLGTMFQTYQLGNLGLTEDDFRRLKRTSSAEMAKQQGQFGKLSRDYDLGSKEQRAYQEFSTALSDAGNKIENVFVKGLAPLIPGMEKLSNSVVKSIENLAKAIPPDVMERVGKGIETFAQYLGSDKFQDDVKAFAAGVAWVAGKVKDLGIWAAGPAGRFATGTASAAYGVATNPAAAYGSTGTNTAGLPVKPGAGTVDPGLAGFASSLRARVPGIVRFTSFNDDFHKGTNSAHADNRAFDLTIANPAQSAEVSDLIRKEMARQGIKGTVIDEYKNPSSRATAGHIHVQTDVRVMNAAGSNVIVSSQQVAPSQ